MRPPSKTSLAAVSLALVLTAVPAAADRTNLSGLDGGQLTGSDLEAPVILVVWASWSPRCRDVVGRVNALERKWSGKARVVTVVFQEEPAAVRRFLAEKGLRVPVYLDETGSFSKENAVSTVPWLLVFRGGSAAFGGKLPANPDPVIERALG